MKKLLFILLTLALVIPAYAAPDSLKGIKTAKFVVDLNQGDAKKLRLRLQLIKETIEDIEVHGVKTDVVVAIRGGASKFMTMTDIYIEYEDAKIKGEIFNLVSELHKRGVKLEQCAIALRLLKISPQDIHPKIEVVKNGYASLIGYQNKGYAMLPME